MKPLHGRNRVIIEDVNPQVDHGRHPVCRTIGDEVVVTAAIFADGHDLLAAQLLYRRANERRWRSTPMTLVNNDLWTGAFRADKLGAWRFTIVAWVDHFVTWESELRKRLAAQADPVGTVAAIDAGTTPAPGTSVGWNVHYPDGRAKHSSGVADGGDSDHESCRARLRSGFQAAERSRPVAGGKGRAESAVLRLPARS